MGSLSWAAWGGRLLKKHCSQQYSLSDSFLQSLQLLICSEDKSVAAYNVLSKRLVYEWHGHQEGVNRVAYLSSASLAVSKPSYIQHAN